MNKHGLGSALGEYRLVERLGTGGVGEVYRARDERLGRDVAIKVLTPTLASSPDRLRRFEQEARAASALAHPNIIHIYDVGRQADTPYIVMELVEGPTLRDLISGGPLPARQLFDLAQQLAEGLAKAHQGGIVHRDLKPENILVSRDGYVKIVDFGLAKLIDPATDDASKRNKGHSPDPRALTAQGVVLGTAAYMSPEQAAGEPVDWRSDLFSFGAILYEMACGDPAFRGESFASTLMAVIRAKPEPLAKKGIEIPSAIEQIVDRCLKKATVQRPDSTLALAQALRAAGEHWSWSRGGSATSRTETHLGPRTGSFDSMTRSRRNTWLVVAAVIATLGGLLLAVVLRQPRDVAPQRGQLKLLVSERHPQGRAQNPSLAPDGTLFAYVGEKDGRTDLFVARLGGGDHLRLTDDDARETHPSFGPDSERLVYTRHDADGPRVCIIPVLGGRSRVIATDAVFPALSPDGRHVAYVRSRREGGLALTLSRLDGARLDGARLDGARLDGARSDGAPLEGRVLLTSDSEYPFLFRPTFSPDGRTLAIRRGSGGVAGELWLIPTAGGPPRRLGNEPAGIFTHDPAWHPDGHSIVVSSNRAGAVNLWSMPIDGGEPVALTTGPGPDEQPSVSRDGRIVFSTTSWRYGLRLFDLESSVVTPLDDHLAYLWAPAFTADGETVIFSRAETDGDWQLWQIPRGGGRAERLTDDESGAIYPRPLDDGSVLFTTWTRPQRLMRRFVASDLRQDPPDDAFEDLPEGAFGDPAPDGERIAFVRPGTEGERVFVIDGPGRAPRQLVEGPATLPRWSPDGRRIAFSRDRSTGSGIFVVDADGGEPRRLTATGGWPVWWPDGSRVGFLAKGAEDNQVIRTVDIDDGTIETFDALRFTGTNHPFDIAPDGRALATSDSVPLDDEIWLLEP